MRDSFDKAAVDSAKALAASKAAERAKRVALSELLASVHGRKFLWDFLAEANCFAQTYIQGSFDGTAFREGQRSSGNKLLTYIVTNFPASYLTMTKENTSVEIKDIPDE